MNILCLQGLDSDEKIWWFVNEYFSRFSTNKQGTLNFDEMKAFLTEYLQIDNETEQGK